MADAGAQTREGGDAGPDEEEATTRAHGAILIEAASNTTLPMLLLSSTYA